MAEYIDVAQLFRCETCYHIGSDGKCNSYCDASESYRPSYSKLKKADVVEVVRCKECIHWGGVAFGNICRRWSAPIAGMKNRTQPDDFCSCGERKDGAE